ncbi:hypothetical protein ES705_16466 [subsurface metagenome]
MVEDKVHMCPVFPDLICPQGKAMSDTCSVRINGNFDPMANFRDHLLLHCALYQNQQYSDNFSKEEV